MEETTRLAKGREGYGYKYTELAQINEWLEAKGESYYQFTEDYNGKDYIMTVKVGADGKESEPIRGCQIIDGNTLNGGKANIAQQLGAAITYARRYSLLMAYGLATEDDDAENLTTQPKAKDQPTKTNKRDINNPTAADIAKLAAETASQLSNPKMIDNQQAARIQALAKEKGIFGAEILKRYKVDSLNKLTADQAANCIKSLEATQAR